MRIDVFCFGAAKANWFLLLYWWFVNQVSAYCHLLYCTVYYKCKHACAQNDIIKVKLMSGGEGREEQLCPGIVHTFWTSIMNAVPEGKQS